MIAQATLNLDGFHFNAHYGYTKRLKGIGELAIKEYPDGWYCTAEKKRYPGDMRQWIYRLVDHEWRLVNENDYANAGMPCPPELVALMNATLFSPTPVDTGMQHGPALDELKPQPRISYEHAWHDLVHSGYPGISGGSQDADDTAVETYNLHAANGRHIRKATRVRFADGQSIAFTERLSKREAIRQALIERQRQEGPTHDA